MSVSKMRRHRVWTMPDDARFSVLWLRMLPEQHIEFLQWSALSGIPLWQHRTSTGSMLIAQEVSSLAADRIPIDVDTAIGAIDRMHKRQSASLAIWYIIETNEDNLMLIKLKWA